MKTAFVQALEEAAAANPRVLLVTGDLGFGAFEAFARRFPKQYLNAGVSEQNMAGLAAGMAIEGRTVFTYSIGNFPTLRCLEQIRNDICGHGASVKVVSMGGGMSYGALGSSHHAIEDLAILRALPGMTVIAPGDLWEAAQAVRALAAKPGPAFLRLDKSWAERAPSLGETFEIGRARIIREGLDMTLIATGGILGEALEAATLLDKAGLSCRVLSMHTVKPLDTRSILEAARETRGIVTIEEHTLEGGLGSAVTETLLDLETTPRVFHRVGIRDGYSPGVGSQAYLRRVHGLDAEAIARAVLSKIAAKDAARRTAA